MDKIRSDLKGADFNEKLIWKTDEGFDVMPFYRQEDLEKLNHLDFFLPLFLRGDVRQPADRGVQEKPERGDIKEEGNNSWLIRQDITVSEYCTANEKALSVLMKGVDSIGFIIKDPDSVNEENLTMLLKDINPECAEINFHPEGKAIEIIKLITGIWLKNGFNLSLIRGAVEADPLGRLVVNGKLCVPVDAGFDYLASLVRETLAIQDYRCIHINGKWFKNSGSDSVLELAFTLSMAVEYMNQLTERGINPELAAKAIRFSYGVGSSYFMEIAKLRAARLLWSVVCGKYGLTKGDSCRMEIHCGTSNMDSNADDPYINIIRTQTEAMSAVIGGTDSLTVNPFDSPFCQPDEFSERIARNQQLILREEAYFGKVADPSAGSYYIENLTSLVAENAWELFLEIEENGGFLSAFNTGLILAKLAESSARVEKDNDINKTDI